jgi:hypothetical protein
MPRLRIGSGDRRGLLRTLPLLVVGAGAVALAITAYAARRVLPDLS